MKNFVGAIAWLLFASLLGACGGIGEIGGSPAGTAAAPQPAPESHAWDSWNWDQGGFGD